MEKKMNNKGFSLVELIIVIAIMAVLIGVLAPQYLKYVKKSKISTDITNAEEIATAVNAAVSDGALSLPASGASTTFTDAASIENISAFPDSKLNPGSASWSVTLDHLGLKSITLNDTAIWPDSSSYEAQ